MRKIVQVLTFQIFIWFHNATLSFIVIKNQSGKGTFWTPCIFATELKLQVRMNMSSLHRHTLLILSYL